MEKSIFVSTLPCTAQRGRRVAFFACSPEDLINKGTYSYIIIKRALKITFLLQSLETEKFLKIYAIYL
jgi:hypothetical protein